jgi:sec-independent protein translocase protein TatA
MPNVGPIEIIILLLILIVIFGPKRIPELGRSVGQGMRNFKQSVTGRDRADEGRELERRSTEGPARPEPARTEVAGAEASPVEAGPVSAPSRGAGESEGAATAPDGSHTPDRAREPGL